MTMTMKKAWEVADRYLQGFYVTPDDVTAAFRKISTSTNAAAPSYVSRMEQRMQTDTIEGRTTTSKPGRPAVGDQVKIAFPAELLAQIDRAAAAAGISRSAWVRQACLDSLAQDGMVKEMTTAMPEWMKKHPCEACGTGYGQCAQFALRGLMCCRGCHHPSRWVENPWTPADIAEMDHHIA